MKYKNSIIGCERGGTRKTTFCAYNLAVALLSEAPIRAFELDRQSRLIDMYPDLVEPIELPDDDKLLEDDQALTRAFSPLFSAMTDPDGPHVLVDVGANLDASLSMSMLRNRLPMKTEKAGRDTAIFIMIDSDPETILASARTTASFKGSMPDAHFVFVSPERKIEPPTVRTAHFAEALEAFNRTIKPALKTADVFHFPMMRPSTRKAFVEQGASPIDFLDLDPTTIGRGDAFVGDDTLFNFGNFLSAHSKEVERILGFRTED